MKSYGTYALAVLVYRDTTLVFVPHGSRVNDALGRYPHGARDVTHAGGVGPKCVRHPVGGVLPLALWRNRSDQQYGEERGIDSFHDREERPPEAPKCVGGCFRPCSQS